MITIGEATGFRKRRTWHDGKEIFKSEGAARAAIRSLHARNERAYGAVGKDLSSLRPYVCRSEYVKYGETAREFGLAASRGSDFHSPGESHTDLGQLPYLPGELTPVWELLADRIR